jgi:cellulose synthase/poly-beta-1,6-N-acetylglucosamine synthase-like glycosyltransferase
MILGWIVIVFILAYGFLFLYYKRGWQSLPEFISTTNNKSTFISVIIAARNEEKRIAGLLKSLAQQSYPEESFEIIVVDDFSADATAAIVKQLSLFNLSLIQPDVSKNASSKKKAIEAGIKMARGELIVTTDADCIVPPNWLRTLHGFYVQNNGYFIAAPVKFSYGKSLLQIFQSLDFLVLQGITAASAGNQFHIMCNGANLAYKKQAFINVKGFEGIDKKATGDDMLLMHKIKKQTPDRVFYLKSKEAIVSTEPMTSWRDFFMQRKRWASKTLIYDDYRIIALLAFVYLFNCLFFVLLAACFFNPVYWFYLLGFLLLKTAIELPFVTAVAKFYGEQKLMKYFIPFQPLHIFYTVVVGALSQFGKYSWKGRTTK